MPEALRGLASPDITKLEPKLTMSNEIDADEKVKEDTQNELKHKKGCDIFLKRENTFYDNEWKAYSDLWDHWSKALKGKLEVRSDFECDTWNKPMNLLKSIKEHSLSYEQYWCVMGTIVDALKDYFPYV